MMSLQHENVKSRMRLKIITFSNERKIKGKRIEDEFESVSLFLLK